MKGPISNHALFKTLTSALTTRLPILCQSSPQCIALLSSNILNYQQLNASKRPLDQSLRYESSEPEPGIDVVSVAHQDLQSLVSQFSEVQGVVLPFVDRSVLGLDEPGSILGWNQSSSNALKALVYMMCAHSALGKPSSDAEPFYRRALVLLDGLTLRGSSLELGMYNCSIE